MRQLLAFALAFGCVGIAVASGGTKKQADNRVPVKLQIHHADPWAVKAMIEGAQITQPELSTIWGVSGGQGRQTGNTQQGKPSPLLQDGYLVVNPTDNSLWWYPNRQK